MTNSDNETPNQQRARYVTDMLAINEHYGDTEPQNIQDLLSDLMHLCNGKGYDFAEILRVATDNFNGEVMDAEMECGEQSTDGAFSLRPKVMKQSACQTGQVRASPASRVGLS